MAINLKVNGASPFGFRPNRIRRFSMCAHDLELNCVEIRVRPGAMRPCNCAGRRQRRWRSCGHKHHRSARDHQLITTIEGLGSLESRLRSSALFIEEGRRPRRLLLSTAFMSAKEVLETESATDPSRTACGALPSIFVAVCTHIASVARGLRAAQAIG